MRATRPADNRREIWGVEAIRKFMARELGGDAVAMEVRDVVVRGVAIYSRSDGIVSWWA